MTSSASCFTVVRALLGRTGADCSGGACADDLAVEPFPVAGRVDLVGALRLLVDALNTSTCGGKGIVGGSSAAVCVLESTSFLMMPLGACLCSVCMLSIRWKLHSACAACNSSREIRGPSGNVPMFSSKSSKELRDVSGEDIADTGGL